MDSPLPRPDHMLGNPYAPRLVAAGETFDVVEVDDVLGACVLERLRRQGVVVGPVLHDRRYRRMGFFVPVSPKGATWRDRRGPRHHGKGAWITFPPLVSDGRDFLVWRVPPRDCGAPTPLRLVREAITTASAALNASPDRRPGGR